MNKKNLLVIIILAAAVVIAGFFAFLYMNQSKNAGVENSVGGTSVEQQNTSENTPAAQVGGGLTVCLDKCGDGICQKSDPDCKDSMNCICPETPQECPQDCK